METDYNHSHSGEENTFQHWISVDKENKRLDWNVGQTHEKSLLQNITVLPKVQSSSRLLSNWTQGSLLAKPARTDEQTWQKRIRFYAANIHHSSGY